MGGTMRLGAYEAVLARGKPVSEIYGGAGSISERPPSLRGQHNYKDRLEAVGLRLLRHVAGRRAAGDRGDPEHPWFVGVQYHRSSSRSPSKPHPLFTDFIRAARDQSRWSSWSRYTAGPCCRARDIH